MTVRLAKLRTLLWLLLHTTGLLAANALLVYWADSGDAGTPRAPQPQPDRHERSSRPSHVGLTGIPSEYRSTSTCLTDSADEATGLPD